MNGFQKKIIKKALANPSRITEYELTFVTDMNNKSDDYDLTKNQNHILNQISEKVY